MGFVRTAAGTAVLSLYATAGLAEIDILSVTFNCENNTQVPVSYFNAVDGSGAAAMLIEDQLIALKQVQSGSGIRYESVDGAGTYTLRSKGWEATISHQAQGSTAPERVLFKDCSSR
ncbi:MliC family protein [Ruegeria conchae]|uniref:MliC family protein n=1 Tax=Ruegeria conchae TaxID=981384 RepID=UPI00147C5CA1|nr:MliC family protein [Ruegeria conchae]UWR04582.1 MliC family protein [Ruegeria conchae]